MDSGKISHSALAQIPIKSNFLGFHPLCFLVATALGLRDRADGWLCSAWPKTTTYIHCSAHLVIQVLLLLLL